MPSYVADFKCIGGACEDSCCIGWDIDIDKITYRQYFRTKNEAMKTAFRQHIYKNEACDSDEVDYGRVKIKDTTWCPFLNEQKLCDIYQQLGEEFLSNVCTSYPRVLNRVDNQHEISLFMSCPEAARKLLMDDEPIQWLSKKVTLEKHIIHSFVESNDSQWRSSPIRLLKHLRNLSLEYMQDRTYPVVVRLLSLGTHLERIDSTFSKSMQGPFKKTDIIQPVQQPIQQNSTQQNSAQQNSAQQNSAQQNSAQQLAKSELTLESRLFELGFLKELLSDINRSDQVDSQEFLTIIDTISRVFLLNTSTSLREQSSAYHQGSLETMEILSSLEPLFEKYIINFMFQTNFPFSENQSMFDGYMMLIVRYVFIRFLLVGQAVADPEFSREKAVQSIQVFTKTIEHHRSFISNILQELHVKEFNTMEGIQNILNYRG